jgi:hypothetical protein
MSDWEKVEQYVRQHGYTPINVSWESYIASIILYYEGDLEETEREADDYTIDEWLENIGENYQLKDFDYE